MSESQKREGFPTLFHVPTLSPTHVETFRLVSEILFLSCYICHEDQVVELSFPNNASTSDESNLPSSYVTWIVPYMIIILDCEINISCTKAAAETRNI